MISVAPYGALCPFAVVPRNVSHRCVGVGYRVVVVRLPYAVSVCRPCKLIPFVVRQCVAVCVLAHHDDARFAAAVRRSRRCGESVAFYVNVIFSGHVFHGMREMECDVSSVRSERHQSSVVVSQGVGAFLHHCLLRVAGRVERHDVHELSGCGYIFVHGNDVWVCSCRRLRLTVDGRAVAYERRTGGYVSRRDAPAEFPVAVEAEQFS